MRNRRFTSMGNRRFRAKAALAVFAATTASVLGFSSAGRAVAPNPYGWWYEANSGGAYSPPPPSPVPNGGLYVENGFNGPAAISAVSFTVPSGAAVGPLVLHVSGTPVMSQPPIACPLRSPSFKAAQDGRWSDRPSYDCQKAQSTGQVDSARTTVSFDVSSLLENGHVAVAVLAGGPFDSVAFDPPGPDALTLTAPGAAAPPAAPTNGAGDMTAGSHLASSPAPAAGAPLAQISAPAIAPGASPARVPGSAPGTPSTQGSYGPGGQLASVSNGSSSVPTAARIAGLVALALLLLAWTQGYGILGGRIKSLASPLAGMRRRPSADD